MGGDRGLPAFPSVIQMIPNVTASRNRLPWSFEVKHNLFEVQLCVVALMNAGVRKIFGLGQQHQHFISH